jgi:hypothetical protein
METRTLMANSINQQSGTSLDWRQSDFLESRSPTAFCQLVQHKQRIAFVISEFRDKSCVEL